jgi:lipopolysaccharide/colanic/teichoic acid biosynthesis glycosyltransferase
MLARTGETVQSCHDPIELDDVTPPKQAQSEPSRGLYSKSKRLIDVVIVLLIAPAVLIVIAIAGLAIAVAMGRPIFFLSDRVGWKGRTFRMVKLRTMAPSSGNQVPAATEKDDPRITPLGRLLRRSHFDELPQLWNILLGDMTLVGPRPEQPELVAYYRDHLPDYDLRHTVRPGLTGWSQVSFGYAADLAETREKLVYDLEYVERYGPKIDLITAWKTLQVYFDPRFVR